MKASEMPDHPDIRAALLTGYPAGKSGDLPQCPLCHAETNTFFQNSFGEIVGCFYCLDEVSAWEVGTSA